MKSKILKSAIIGLAIAGLVGLSACSSPDVNADPSASPSNGTLYDMSTFGLDSEGVIHNWDGPEVENLPEESIGQPIEFISEAGAVDDTLSAVGEITGVKEAYNVTHTAYESPHEGSPFKFVEVVYLAVALEPGVKPTPAMVDSIISAVAANYPSAKAVNLAIIGDNGNLDQTVLATEIGSSRTWEGLASQSVVYSVATK